MITEEMILGCYYAFIEGNREFVPEGMNETSARMTMSWLNCMLNTGACFNRRGSLMQYRVILERITLDYGSQRAKEAALSQMEYYVRYNRESHIKILERFINI
jgi:hypothetical protein